LNTVLGEKLEQCVRLHARCKPLGVSMPSATLAAMFLSAVHPLAPRAASIRRPVAQVAKTVQLAGTDEAERYTCHAALHSAKACRWSYRRGECTPADKCRAHSCGLVACDCKIMPLAAQPPWAVLELNASSSLSPRVVQAAFSTQARFFHPHLNAGCPGKASAQFLAARRARDMLLVLSAVAASAASLPENDGKHRPQVKPSTAESGACQHDQVAPITKLARGVPLGVAVYRLVTDWFRSRKRRIARGGWSDWLRSTMRRALQLPKAFFRFAIACAPMVAAVLLACALRGPMLA